MSKENYYERGSMVYHKDESLYERVTKELELYQRLKSYYYNKRNFRMYYQVSGRVQALITCQKYILDEMKKRSESLEEKEE